jgi:MtN3 and saliva related transmembrane protein|tara:strand:- start:3475 stop:3729 length:255 start_codon:yes stop_codon:yes gene_type:complete
MVDKIEIIGIIAAFLTTFAFIPQVYKVVKSNRTDGLSQTTFSIFTIGVFLWLIYGFLKNSVSMIIGNGITLILALIILSYLVKK